MKFVGLIFFVGVLFSACSTKNISAQKDFSSPQATFETWAYAARHLDLKLLLDSYAQSARPSMEQDLSRSSRESLEAMQKEARVTKFDIEKVVYENNLAYLRVRRKLRQGEDIEILTMVKEGDHWKLLP